MTVRRPHAVGFWAALLLCICPVACGAPEQPVRAVSPAATRVSVRVATRVDTNCGRLLRVVVRETKRVDFERLTYADLVALEDEQDPFRLASQLILPGGTPEFSVQIAPGASTGFFFLLTEDANVGCYPLATPADAWKRLLEQPCESIGERAPLIEFQLGEQLVGLKTAVFCAEGQ